jgi:hypothetical protein
MKRTLTLFYFSFILLLSIIFYFKPEYNWDILPYMALSMETPSADFKTVHSNIFGIAKTELPVNKYAGLVDSASAYKHITATEAVVFQHELGFYRTRPIFVWLIRFLHWVGFSLTKATVLPSVLSFFLTGVMLFFRVVKTPPPAPPLLKRREGGDYIHIVSLLFCSLIMISPFMVNTARLSTPDMLTAFFLLAACWCLLEKKSVPIVSVLFLLALLSRYDCILFIMLILVWLFITKRRNFLPWLPLIAGMIIITIIQFNEIFFITKHVVFIMSSSERLAGVSGNNFITGYLASVKNGFPSFFYSQVALVSFIFLADISFRRRVLHIGWKDPALLFSLFVYAYIPLRFLIHPVIDDRFLVGVYWIILVSFILNINRVLELKDLDHQGKIPLSKVL